LLERKRGIKGNFKRILRILIQGKRGLERRAGGDKGLPGKGGPFLGKFVSLSTELLPFLG